MDQNPNQALEKITGIPHASAGLATIALCIRVRGHVLGLSYFGLRARGERRMSRLVSARGASSPISSGDPSKTYTATPSVVVPPEDSRVGVRLGSLSAWSMDS